MPRTMTMLLINDGSGNILCEIFDNKKKAIKYLAAWCRGRWEEQDHDEALSAEDDLAVQQYFEFWDPEQKHEVDNKDLNPKPAEGFYITPAMLEAVAEELGYDVTPARVRAALDGNEFTAAYVEGLEEEKDTLLDRFREQGGRGVDLAERIDNLGVRIGVGKAVLGQYRSENK